MNRPVCKQVLDHPTHLKVAVKTYFDLDTDYSGARQENVNKLVKVSEGSESFIPEHDSDRHDVYNSDNNALQFYSSQLYVRPGSEFDTKDLIKTIMLTSWLTGLLARFSIRASLSVRSPNSNTSNMEI